MTLVILGIFCIYFEDKTQCNILYLFSRWKEPPSYTLAFALYTHVHFLVSSCASHMQNTFTLSQHPSRSSTHYSINSQSKISLNLSRPEVPSLIIQIKYCRDAEDPFWVTLSFCLCCVPTKLGNELSASKMQWWHRHRITVTGRMSPQIGGKQPGHKLEQNPSQIPAIVTDRLVCARHCSRRRDNAELGGQDPTPAEVLETSFYTARTRHRICLLSVCCDQQGHRSATVGREGSARQPVLVKGRVSALSAHV